MGRILATIKAPLSETEQLKQQLMSSGVQTVEIEMVPYERFVKESRLNYDCVYPQAWAEKVPVAYINFSFDGTEEGRAASFSVEYNVMQVPLNLRYEFES